MPKITRNFYFTQLIAMGIIIVAGSLFRDSEIGMFAALMAAFVIGLTLLDVLDDREKRRHEESKG
jgi:hypothetical protein